MHNVVILMWVLNCGLNAGWWNCKVSNGDVHVECACIIRMRIVEC